MMNGIRLTVQRARDLIATDEWLSSHLRWRDEIASHVAEEDRARERFELEQEIGCHVFRRLRFRPPFDPAAKQEIEEDVIPDDALRGLMAVLSAAASVEADDPVVHALFGGAGTNNSSNLDGPLSTDLSSVSRPGPSIGRSGIKVELISCCCHQADRHQALAREWRRHLGLPESGASSHDASALQAQAEWFERLPDNDPRLLELAQTVAWPRTRLDHGEYTMNLFLEPRGYSHSGFLEALLDRARLDAVLDSDTDDDPGQGVGLLRVVHDALHETDTGDER